MHNFLYITYVDYRQKAFPGVEAKIDGQIGALRQAGYHVDRVNQFGAAAQLVNCVSGEAGLFEAASSRFAILAAVKAALSRKTYLGAYIRFQFFSEDVRRMLSLLKKQGVRVVLEIPTYPYDGELKQQGPKGYLKLLCDSLFKPACVRKIDRITTVSDDRQIFGVPCINILNGLDYSALPLRQVRQPDPQELHLIAVASMQPWQGYDRLLEGLADYYRQEQPVRVVAHLIGDGVSLPGYRKFVSSNGLEDCVHFYGQLDRQGIRRVADGCDLAVGALGTFRRGGVTKLSTLKSREYCALGFPSVNATPTDILDPNDPCCLYIPEDASPVDIPRVVEFYQDVYFRSGKTAEEVALSVREKAMALSDSAVVFRCVIDYFVNTRK